MKKTCTVFVGVLALWLATCPAGAETEPTPAGSANAEPEPDAASQKYQSLLKELKALQGGLAAKQAQAAELRHKWIVSKGRNPTKEELEDFEKKRAKGKATTEDNPYVTKTPLSSPARWRLAYHEKLAEIERDKAAIVSLERQIAALKAAKNEPAAEQSGR
jgi:hypothetical protein